MKILVLLITLLMTATSFGFDLSAQSEATFKAFPEETEVQPNLFDFSDEVYAPSKAMGNEIQLVDAKTSINDLPEGSYALTSESALKVASRTIEIHLDGELPLLAQNQGVVTRRCLSDDIYASTVTSVVTAGNIRVKSGICSKKAYSTKVLFIEL